MNADVIVRMFQLNHYAIMKNIEGLTQEESLRAPAPGGSSLNWVLGHIVATRNIILKQLDREPILRDREAAVYARGSDGRSAERALELDALIAALNDSQPRLVEGLKSLPAERLAASLASEALGENLAGLQFHEAYHAGQLGLLRRLIGRDGAIR
jgi:uncharacterized damage-inducible protein DinB